MTIETKTTDTWICDTCEKKVETSKGSTLSWYTITIPSYYEPARPTNHYCTQFCAIKSFGRTPGGLQEMQKVLNNE